MASNTPENKSKFTLYLICEGTPCDLVEKSMKMGRSSTPVSSGSGGICDYGLIESFYFSHNTKNTDHFDDAISHYMVTTKPSAIDSALIMYAGTSPDRRVYPVPYTNTNSKYTKSKSQIRAIMDMFGQNTNVNNYMSQPKYSSFTEFLPRPNVALDWSMTTSEESASAYQSAQISRFLKMISEYRETEAGKQKSRYFLVCEPEFIVAMINMVSGNRFTQQDLIEHSSFWSFDIHIKSGFFGTSHSVKSRRKLYPLMRNPGYLHTFDRLFYYLYKDAKVPLFQYNRLIPQSYLRPKYLTLCSRFLIYAMKNGHRSNSSGRSSGKGKGKASSINSMPKSSLGKLLKSFGKQSNFTK